MRILEGTVEKETTELCQKHAQEVAEIKKQMREQLSIERERLLNQIRELTVMKEHAKAEVSSS